MPAAALAPPAAPPEGAEPSPPAEAAPGAVALAQPPEPPVRPGTGETEVKPAVPVTLNVPANVRVRDRSSFIIGKTVYRLATTDGLGINTRCSVEKGKGCFWRPMRSLKVAIAGATLFCRPATGGAWTCSKKQAAAQR
jgi:hypothetical protein